MTGADTSLCENNFNFLVYTLIHTVVLEGPWSRYPVMTMLHRLKSVLRINNYIAVNIVTLVISLTVSLLYNVTLWIIATRHAHSVSLNIYNVA